MKLYHGTAGRHLRHILKHGLQPRGLCRQDNWDHTVASNEKAVYLTTCYAPYFAINAASQSRGRNKQAVVLEIDTDRLPQELFVPDEDALYHSTKKSDTSLPPEWGMVERVAYYRDHLKEYAAYWRDSLRVLGTCAFMGTIPPDAITRIVSFDLNDKTNMWLFSAFMDASISPINYQLVGKQFRYYTTWLFGDAPHPNDMPREFDLDPEMEAKYRDKPEYLTRFKYEFDPNPPVPRENIKLTVR